MASDSQGNDSGIGRCKLQKLFRKTIKKKEHLIGVCGFYEAALMFLDWYGTQRQDLFDRLNKLGESDDFGALIWTGRKLLYTDRFMRLNESHEDYYAMGSGAAHAITALDCGKSAVQAIQFAIKRDINSGGRIQSITLGAPSGKPRI
jgi:hypothetical protein